MYLCDMFSWEFTLNDGFSLQELLVLNVCEFVT